MVGDLQPGYLDRIVSGHVLQQLKRDALRNVLEPCIAWAVPHDIGRTRLANRQRRGLGRRLMQALAVELRQSPVVEILLEVRASNQPALAFYRRLGFLETGRRPRYYADPEQDAVLMTMRLDAPDL